MAFLTESYPRFHAPTFRINPKDNDIVINGVAYDPATFLPKVGKPECFIFDQSTTAGQYTHTIDDTDGSYKFVPCTQDATLEPFMTFAFPVGAKRHITSGRAIDAADWKILNAARADWWSRDWAEHPAQHQMWDPSNNKYYMAASTIGYYGQYCVYEGNTNKLLGEDLIYNLINAYQYPMTMFGLQDDGLIALAMEGTTSHFSPKLVRNPYSSEPDLKTGTFTDIFSPTATNQRGWITYMGKMDNGDMIFYSLFTTVQQNIIRVQNSNGSVTYEFTDYDVTTNIPTVPSQVVRHQETGETTTSKKIFYTMGFDHTSGWYYNEPQLFEMDTAAGTISKTTCTFSPIGQTEAYNDFGAGTHIGNMMDLRIMSNSQDLDAQKYLFVFPSHSGFEITSTTSTTCYDANNDNIFWWVHKISASNAASTSIVEYGKWDDILTSSTRNTSMSAGHDAMVIPWCVAPLNPEHTLMMVFAQYSTHVIKWDTSTETFSEVWFDDNMIITEAAWFPQGKVITNQHDNRRDYNGGVYLGMMYAQIWSEDMIYKVDVLPDTSYVAYSGTNISANVGFTAYNANNSLVSTDLKIKINGPAEWSGGAKVKDITTSASGNTVQTLTITGDGQIEFQVMEVQSI
jgi:hypothetical protein